MGTRSSVPPGEWFEWKAPFSRAEWDEYRALWHAKQRNATLAPQFRVPISKAQEGRFRRFERTWKKIGRDPDDMPALPFNVQFKGGRGGAAIGRGKYKPLPPGHSAIDQQRALDKIRESYIRAIESGEFELCKKGSRPTAAPASPGGNRTASENEAVRRRFEQAGYR